MSKFKELEQAVKQAEVSYADYETGVHALWKEFGAGLPAFLEASRGGVAIEPVKLKQDNWQFRVDLNLADITISYCLAVTAQPAGHQVIVLLDGMAPESFQVRSQNRAEDLAAIYKRIFEITKSYCENNVKFFQENKGYPRVGFPD